MLDDGYCFRDCEGLFDQENVFAFMRKNDYIGTTVGSITTTITIVVLSLPLCCGVMRDLSSLKFMGIAIFCSAVAAFCCFIPTITAYVGNSQDAFFNHLCP